MPFPRSALFIHDAFLLTIARQGSIYNFLHPIVRRRHFFCRFYIGFCGATEFGKVEDTEG